MGPLPLPHPVYPMHRSIGFCRPRQEEFARVRLRLASATCTQLAKLGPLPQGSRDRRWVN